MESKERDLPNFALRFNWENQKCQNSCESEGQESKEKHFYQLSVVETEDKVIHALFWQINSIQ